MHLALEVLRVLEDLLDGPGDHTDVLGLPVAALHGEGLAGAGLAVGEHAHVVAVDGGLHELADLLEHVALRRRGLEHAVELELVLGRLVLVAGRVKGV